MGPPIQVLRADRLLFVIGNRRNMLASAGAVNGRALQADGRVPSRSRRAHRRETAGGEQRAAVLEVGSRHDRTAPSLDSGAGGDTGKRHDILAKDACKHRISRTNGPSWDAANMAAPASAVLDAAARGARTAASMAQLGSPLQCTGGGVRLPSY
jgi:hypothetical protein